MLRIEIKKQTSGANNTKAEDMKLNINIRRHKKQARTSKLTDRWKRQVGKGIVKKWSTNDN